MKTKVYAPEIDTAFNVLLRALNVEAYDVEPETMANLMEAISKDVKVRNSALLYLTCSSNRAETMRSKLERDVLELYERGY